MLIRIDTDGTVKGLYSDELAEIGRGMGDSLEVCRLSHIEFNNERQSWEVEILGSNPKLIIDGFQTRAEALDWEQLTFEQQLAEGRMCI
jgi:hypothetical protein